MHNLYLFLSSQNVKVEPSSEDAPSPYTDISMMEEDTNDRVSILIHMFHVCVVSVIIIPQSYM